MREISVYTSSSQLADPRQFCLRLLKDLAASRELAWRLFLRNVSSHYRHTLFGYTFAFLPPALNAGVFIFLHSAGYFAVADTQVPYTIFILASVTLWQTFADAAYAPLRLVQQSRSILTKVNFPREALILAGVGEVLFAALIRLVMIAIALIAFGMSVTWSAALFPLGLVALIAMGTSLGLLILPLGLLYHDIGQSLPFLLYLWMFLTPVIYPAPAPQSGSISMFLNPVSPVLDTTRNWLLSAPAQYLSGFLIVAGLTFVALLAGWLLYRLALPILIERMSA